MNRETPKVALALRLAQFRSLVWEARRSAGRIGSVRGTGTARR